MLISRSVYRQIEGKARNRAHLTDRAEEQLQRARDRAYSLPGMRTDTDRVTTSRNPDKIGRKVQAVIEAEQALGEAMKWADVFRETDRKYPPTGDGPGMVAALSFGSGCTLAEISETLKISRQTALRRREEWVIHVALLAAEKHLITLNTG